MEQKKTIASQNSWLSAHVNKVPVDGSFSFSQTPERLGMNFDFYMSWFGFRLAHEYPVTYYPGFSEYEIAGARSKADLQFRLIGDNIQNSTLVLRTGVGYDDVRGVNGFDASYFGFALEPELQIYLAHFVGVWGTWAYRFPARSANHSDLELSGNSWKAAAFLELGAIRTEVGYEQREWNFRTRASSTVNRQKLSNIFAAIKFFY